MNLAGNADGGVLEELPMFPLGLVALPHTVIPLRLFEPRYLALHDRLAAGTGEFGIVLIERGVAEAQGGTYFDVGSVVRMADWSRLEDGTIVLAAVATDRLRITEWLDDDPYPRAIIRRLGAPTAGHDLVGRVDRCRVLLRRALDIAGVPPEIVDEAMESLSEDPVRSLYELARIGPLQDLDLQRILEADEAAAAAHVLEEELRATIRMFEGPASPS